LILVALTLVALDTRSRGGGVIGRVRNVVADGFSPLQSATHDILSPIGNFVTGAVNYSTLRNQNQRLRNQVAAMSVGAAQAAAAEQAASEVLKEQGLTFVGSIPTRTVQIIDRGSSNFSSSLTVDKGTSQGIAVGQPVVATGGLVGTVETAGVTTSTIRLMSDPSFSVGVSLQGGNIGSVSGQGQGRPLVVTVDTTSLKPPTAKAGDLLYTSGLALETFPKGIPVGRVTKVSSVPGSLEPTIDVTPIVNVAAFSYLQVLLWSPP
jgi:rod shape-determining protein MreC